MVPVSREVSSPVQRWSVDAFGGFRSQTQQVSEPPVQRVCQPGDWLPCEQEEGHLLPVWCDSSAWVGGRLADPCPEGSSPVPARPFSSMER